MWPTKSKYRNIKTTRVLPDGSVAKFDSKREAARWDELCSWQKLAAISNLQRQVPFLLSVNGKKIGKLILDFTYTDNLSGQEIFEDVKSGPTMTPIFRWKARHFEAQYNKKVSVVK